MFGKCNVTKEEVTYTKDSKGKTKSKIKKIKCTFPKNHSGRHSFQN